MFKGKLSSKVRKILIVTVALVMGFIMFIYRDWLSQDTILLSFLAISIVIGNASAFLWDWTPIFIFYYAYEFSRGHLTQIQSFFHITVNNTALYNIDKFIFGPNIPILQAQKLIQPQITIIDYIAFLWYTSFFWVPILIGYILWVKDRRYFKVFRNAYLILCFSALFTFLVFPAAPPWMASQLGILPYLNTNTWGRLYVGSLSTGLFSIVGANAVAPFPSLHVGWSVLSSYMMQSFTYKRIKGWSYLFYLYPLIMCFVVTYSSDHYVIDMIGGAVYATIAIIVAENYAKWWKIIMKKIRELLKRDHKEQLDLDAKV